MEGIVAFGMDQSVEALLSPYFIQSRPTPSSATHKKTSVLHTLYRELNRAKDIS